MEIVINDGQLFRKIVSCIKDLTNVSEFTFDQKGISIQAIDLAHICLIDGLLHVSSFEKMKFQNPDIPIKLGFNFENLNNILKLSKTQTIGITYTKESDKMQFNLSENIKKKINFEMTLTEVEQEPLEVTELTHSFIVYLSTEEFQRSMKDLSAFGDTCNIIVTNDNITFIVTGEAGTGKICMDDVEIENIDDTKEIKIAFKIKYLSMFAKANLADEVVLKFSNVSPFCCEYKLDDSHLRFYLAQIMD